MTATNTVTTTATTRANLGESTVLDGFLKDVYLPGITNTLYFDDGFSRAIERSSEIIEADGRRIVRAFETQYGGGVGPIAEGGDFRASVPAKGKQGTEWVKYFNMIFALSGPTIKTVAKGEGSYIDAVTRHVQDVGKKAKLHFERQCMGEQNGRLAAHTDADVTGTADTTAFDVTGDAYFDTMFLLPGEEIEYRNPVNGTATLRTAIDGTNNYTSVYSISRKGTKKTGSVARGRYIAHATLSANVTQNDWICLRDSYTSAAGGTCMEMNGLRNLVTDNVNNSSATGGIDESTGSNYTSTWGLTVLSYDWLKSYVHDLGEVSFDEENLLEIIMEATTTYGAKPNMLVVSKRALIKYFTSTNNDRFFNTLNAYEWTGGFTGLGIQLGTDKFMLTAINSCPSNNAFLINTNDFKFASATNGYEWLTNDGGGILSQKEGSDNKFATAVDYRQFVCYDPQKQTKIIGILE